MDPIDVALERALADIEAMGVSAQARADEAELVHGQLMAIKAEGTSGPSGVRVVVDYQGVPQQISVDNTGVLTSPYELNRAVALAQKRAHSSLAKALRALLESGDQAVAESMVNPILESIGHANK